jgi:purine-binding chemotaxis protein CheW
MNEPRRVTMEAGAAEVLRRRAAELARPAQADTLAAQGLQALAFSVGEQRCLIEVRWLREVLPLREPLPMPMSAQELLGLVPWRGRMLPVLDLAALLAMAAGPAVPPRRLLVLASRSAALALAVTEVHGLQPLAADEVERRSQPLENLRPEIVRGVTRDGHLWLAAERLLAMQRSSGPEPLPP